MLTQFITNVVIIDDNDADDQKAQVLKNLLSFFKKEDIAASHYYPTDLKKSSIVFKKNKQLIFLDLHLDSSKDVKRNIQEEIRPLLKKVLPADFGNYGIIMWTKYIDDLELLKEKIQEDKFHNKYPTPLFIVGLDKMKYITAGNFSTLLADIENILKNDTAATFFLEWSNSVQHAQNITISNIYSLMPDYKSQSDDITVILTKLALNHTGIKNPTNGYPLHIDAFKAFDEILNGELINSHVSSSINVVNTAKKFSDLGTIAKVYAYLNSAILIDSSNLNQNMVIPGNVYEIQNNSIFRSDKAPVNAKNIVLEVTPPCDFSNSGKRVRARLVGGFLVDANINDTKKQIENLKCKKDCFYTEIYPVMIPNNQNPQLLILDFRHFGSEEDCNLQNSSKYKILFRAKPKLFADILQKLSSHAARLGLSVIHS